MNWIAQGTGAGKRRPEPPPAPPAEYREVQTKLAIVRRVNSRLDKRRRRP